MQCPKCGVDWHIIRLMLASPEVDNRTMAQVIILNCKRCEQEARKWLQQQPSLLSVSSAVGSDK